MDSVDKRMHFFDRQFLRASDFQAEQAYHLDRRRRHNAGFHSHGVVEGLLVVPSEDANHVKIEPGWAVDPLGREIVLVASRTVPIEGVNVNIWMAYPDPEPLSDPSPDPGVTGDTRIHEAPVLRVVPPDSIPANGIQLATVSRGVIRNDVRPLAGLNDRAVTEPKLANNAVSTRTLADDAVTGPKIADNTIQMGNLHPDLRSRIESGGAGDDAIQSAMIADADGTSSQNTSTGRGVKTGHLQNNAVSTAKVADNAVTTAKIADNAVTTAKIADNAVTTAKIADNALFYTKLRGELVDIRFSLLVGQEDVFQVGPAGAFIFVSVNIATAPPRDSSVNWSLRARFNAQAQAFQDVFVRNGGAHPVNVILRAFVLTEPS
jgi:hypothetical protein